MVASRMSVFVNPCNTLSMINKEEVSNGRLLYMYLKFFLLHIIIQRLRFSCITVLVSVHIDLHITW